jgi:lipopolysaccharide/colanic/teichoic acid biosynthesis glycosyltransferase
MSATSTPRRGELLVAPARETADIASKRQSAGGTGAIYVYTKRCTDVVGALLLLLVSAPVLLLIALLIVLDSRGPAFYRQERVGARGRRRGRRIVWEERRFRILKFRTMVRDADRAPVHEQFIESFVAGGGAADGDFKLRGDARVTRVGRFLRATSLDELPQLINVLRGTMSLVGPRPVPAYEVALYQPWHRERLAAMPGMTGPWQVHGRGRVSFDDMVRLDIQYVREASLRHDLVLLLRTLPAVWSKDGAR